MLKSLKTCSRCVWAGLLVSFIMGCGGTLSTSPGGISEDKYSREASTVSRILFLDQPSAPLESSPPSTLTPDKYSRDASDRFPDPFLGKGR